MAEKTRIDLLMVSRGLAATRSLAQRMVMAGEVRVNGELVVKPSVKVPGGVTITIAEKPRFVSRGGDKLQAAFDAFPISSQGKICSDVGASTGGFTDCLLQNGAVKVFAIDVGKGILDWKLRKEDRVVVMEGTNARYIDLAGSGITFVSIDASFISLKLLLPVVRDWFDDQGGEVVALVKPQFEAGRKVVAKGKGVVRDPAVHREVLFDVLTFAQDLGFAVAGLVQSPLHGPKGNIEFLAWLKYPGEPGEIEKLIDSIIPFDETDQNAE